MSRTQVAVRKTPRTQLAGHSSPHSISSPSRAEAAGTAASTGLLGAQPSRMQSGLGCCTRAALTSRHEPKHGRRIRGPRAVPALDGGRRRDGAGGGGQQVDPLALKGRHASGRRRRRRGGPPGRRRRGGRRRVCTGSTRLAGAKLALVAASVRTAPPFLAPTPACPVHLACVGVLVRLDLRAAISSPPHPTGTHCHIRGSWEAASASQR